MIEHLFVDKGPVDFQILPPVIVDSEGQPTFFANLRRLVKAIAGRLDLVLRSEPVSSLAGHEALNSERLCCPEGFVPTLTDGQRQMSAADSEAQVQSLAAP